ncbi:hypothetical protein Tco_0958248 [Tanacetum coccineum]
MWSDVLYSHHHVLFSEYLRKADDRRVSAIAFLFACALPFAGADEVPNVINDRWYDCFMLESEEEIDMVAA